MNKKELNEIQRFQEMIQTSVDLIEGEFADVAIDAEVVTSPYFASTQAVQEAIHAFGEERIQEHIGFEVKGDTYFKCSFKNCQDPFMDDFCEECFTKYRLKDMHYCKQHSLHCDHEKALPLPLIADGKEFTDDANQKALPLPLIADDK
jgi:hypothetical protein